MGKTEKNWKENHAAKVTKLQKPKDENNGMNKTEMCKKVCHIFLIKW